MAAADAASLDLRVVKTQRAIKGALVELMDEIGFAKTTVTRIIERAEVNRSTFYAHYLDKYDLLEAVEEELLDGFRSRSDGRPAALFDAGADNLDAMMAHLTELAGYIRDNGRLFALLVSEKGDRAFLGKLGEMNKSVWDERQLTQRLAIPRGYASAALFGMVTGLITEWVSGGFVETPEQFGQIVYAILKGIPENIFTDAVPSAPSAQ
ncbi:MAG: TetR/AcrR family transcriptional regulator [Actinobacteria bacterium]|nr:TetR/AcrR family transcriptional regulator [Actinomycetota bacterium]